MVVLPGIVWLGVDGDVYNLPFLLGGAVTLYAGFKLAKLSLSHKRTSLQLTFWLFVYCFFGLAASAEMKTNTFPWGNSKQTPGNLVATSLFVASTLVAYELGLRRKQLKLLYRITGTLGDPSFNRYLAMTIFCVAISLFAIVKQGGLSEALKTRFEVDRTFSVQQTAKSEFLIYGTLQHNPPIIAMLVTLYLLSLPSARGNRRRILLFLAVGLAGFNLLANYPPSLPRVNLGSMVMATVLLLSRDRPRAKPALTLFAVLALTLMFPYLDYFRNEQGYSVKDVQKPAQVLTTKADYDAFQMVSNTVAVVEENGVDYGYHVLGSLLFFVPRELWLTKPNGTGATVGEQVGYTFFNLSSPLWAELYYAGGLFTALLGFWLYGNLTGSLEKTEGSNNACAVLVAFLAGYQVYFLRGDLMNAAAYSTPSLLLTACFFFRSNSLVWTRRTLRSNKSMNHSSPNLEVQSS